VSEICIPNGILTISDECEPFMFEHKRFSVSKQWGPFQCDRHGDPIDKQPDGDILQRAYEHYLATRTA
jgi:hypothetical protein